jgi:hypothetical protein
LNVDCTWTTPFTIPNFPFFAVFLLIFAISLLINIKNYYFFLPAIVCFGPRRARAFVRVR